MSLTLKTDKTTDHTNGQAEHEEPHSRSGNLMGRLGTIFDRASRVAALGALLYALQCANQTNNENSEHTPYQKFSPISNVNPSFLEEKLGLAPNVGMCIDRNDNTINLTINTDSGNTVNLHGLELGMRPEKVFEIVSKALDLSGVDGSLVFMPNLEQGGTISKYYNDNSIPFARGYYTQEGLLVEGEPNLFVLYIHNRPIGNFVFLGNYGLLEGNFLSEVEGTFLGFNPNFAGTELIPTMVTDIGEYYLEINSIACPES